MKKEGKNNSVGTRFYLVPSISTGSTCQDRQDKVEPCLNRGDEDIETIMNYELKITSYNYFKGI